MSIAKKVQVEKCVYCQHSFVLSKSGMDDKGQPIMVRSVVMGDFICYACFQSRVIKREWCKKPMLFNLWKNGFTHSKKIRKYGFS